MLSLERLGVDALDLVHLRLGDSTGPVLEPISKAFETLVDLQKQGIIRHLGVSNATAEQVQEAQAIAPIVSVQNLYNFANRSDAYIPFVSLEGFTPLQSDALSAVARRLSATPMSVALAWLLHRSPNLRLIPGASSVSHLHENMAGAALSLSDADLHKLGQVSGEPRGSLAGA
jgi:pyridoxine 4-dehydrogenase